MLCILLKGPDLLYKNLFQAPVAQIDLNPSTQDDCCFCLNKEDNLSTINFSFCTGSIKIKLYLMNDGGQSQYRARHTEQFLQAQTRQC